VIKQRRQKKPLGEACFSEEQDGSRLSEEELDGDQAEKGRQAIWNPEKGERNPLLRFRLLVFVL